MELIDALELVYELAEQNTRQLEECDDAFQERIAGNQEEALAIVHDFLEGLYYDERVKS